MSSASRSGNPKKKSNRKLIRLVLTVLAIAVIFLLYKFLGPNTGSFAKNEYLYIRTGSTYDQVKETLKNEGFVKDMGSFDFLARQVNYPEHVHAGKYKIEKGMSSIAIIKLLRSGKQTPVKLVINKLRTKDDFIRLVSNNLEADSNVLRQMLADNTYLAQFGLDSNTAMCAVMPNTYEFFWNISADKVFKKIAKSYTNYWTDARKQKAKTLGLTPQQVITVASIVDEETNNNPEKPNVASVYLNRYKKGMRLQADPTARFAFGDFTINRISTAQTTFPSPYNTYYVKGLPPGPICTPSTKSIEAVLNAPATTYMYFCAKGDGTGTHLFASTYEEHLKNARLYHQALDSQNIH